MLLSLFCPPGKPARCSETLQVMQARQALETNKNADHKNSTPKTKNLSRLMDETRFGLKAPRGINTQNSKN